MWGGVTHVTVDFGSPPGGPNNRTMHTIYTASTTPYISLLVTSAWNNDCYLCRNYGHKYWKKPMPHPHFAEYCRLSCDEIFCCNISWHLKWWQLRLCRNISKTLLFIILQKMAYSSPVLLEPLQEEKAKCDNHNAVMCDHCNGFYAKAIFHLHKHRCTAAKAGMTSVSVPLSTATQSRTNFHKQFFYIGMQLSSSVKRMSSSYL